MQKYFLFIIFFFATNVFVGQTNHKSPEELLKELEDTRKYLKAQDGGEQKSPININVKENSKYDEGFTPPTSQTDPNIANKALNKYREEGRKKEAESIFTILFIVILLILISFFILRKIKKVNPNNLKIKENRSKEKIVSVPEIDLKDVATELEKISDLKTKGIITEEEYLKLKERIIK